MLPPYVNTPLFKEVTAFMLALIIFAFGAMWMADQETTINVLKIIGAGIGFIATLISLSVVLYKIL